jgi:RNA polymerase sigma-70 factor (ECF subfamily)
MTFSIIEGSEDRRGDPIGSALRKRGMNVALAIAPAIGMGCRREAPPRRRLAAMSGRSVEHETSQLVFAAQVKAIADRRDRAAFLALFDHYAPRLKAYLKRLGASDAIAEDLAQEAMLTVWRKAEKYDPAKAAVGTWIFTIARNLRIDALRREQRPELAPDDPLLSPEAALPADAGIDLARRQQRVREVLRELPPEQAEIITLSFYGDRSHGEIATTLGIPLGTVKSRMRLAFLRVRRALGDLA